MNQETSDRYMVVSDVHLGGKEVFPEHHRAFCEFLSWIRDLPSQGRSVPFPGKDGTMSEKTIHHPTKIVLLGDILEMWDPREQNRDYITADLIEPISILQHTDSDIVYVTGNHDADVGEIISSTNCEKIAANIRCLHGDSVLPILQAGGQQPAPPADDTSRNSLQENTARKNPPEGFAFPWGKGNRTFSVYSRHYFSSEKINGKDAGIRIGDIRYAFLHGHQYDREQITYTMSDVIRSRFDPIDTLVDLATTTFSKQISFNMVLALFAGWILLLAIMRWFPSSPVLPIIGLLFGIAALVQSVLWFGESRKIFLKGRVSRKVEVIFGVLMLVVLGLLVSGIFYPESIFGGLFLLLIILLSILMVTSVVPRIVTRFMRKAYNSLKTKEMTISEIVANNLFKSDLYSKTLETDVIVFGHTHMADRYPKPEDRLSLPAIAAKVRLPFFVNTGCWVSGDAVVHSNTFVTIDNDGIYLFQWLDGNITYLMHFGTDEIRAGYP
jgi:UDP-2,3-diacylglucosamine pyrophosphatase LpxH